MLKSREIIVTPVHTIYHAYFKPCALLRLNNLDYELILTSSRAFSVLRNFREVGNFRKVDYNYFVQINTPVAYA